MSSKENFHFTRETFQNKLLLQIFTSLIFLQSQPFSNNSRNIKICQPLSFVNGIIIFLAQFLLMTDDFPDLPLIVFTISFLSSYVRLNHCCRRRIRSAQLYLGLPPLCTREIFIERSFLATLNSSWQWTLSNHSALSFLTKSMTIPCASNMVTLAVVRSIPNSPQLC